MVQSVTEVLEERGTRYGVFMNQARIAQSLRIVFDEGMKISGKNLYHFAPDELEAISMIFNKLARITNGDPHYSDSWRDIAGYATLVADRLDNDSQKLLESQNDERNRADAAADRNSNEEPRADRETTSEGTGVDSRPTGQSELRRMPVRLVVQDGEHATPTQTSPGVHATPGQ